jgi:hypothetical protein
LSTRLEGAAILFKSDRDALTRLPPVDAARHLYRAFCEHPAVLALRQRHRRHLFHFACQLAQSVATWRLQLTRTSAYWQLLSAAVDGE